MLLTLATDSFSLNIAFAAVFVSLPEMHLLCLHLSTLQERAWLRELGSLKCFCKSSQGQLFPTFTVLSLDKALLSPESS